MPDAVARVATFDLDGFLDAWNAHDVERVLEHYAEDAELMRPTLATPVRGREALGRRFRAFLVAFPDWRMEARARLVGEREAAALLRIAGTQEGDLALGGGERIPASGRRVAYDLAVFARLDEAGRIAREDGVFDVAGFARQLGVTPDLLLARGAPLSSRLA